MRPTYPAAILATLLLCFAAGCDNRACVPGETQACFGPGQCAGVQVCNSAGSAYTVCACDTPPDAGPPRDAGPRPDVMAPSGPRRVFVTSARYPGGFERSGSFPGADSASAYCMLHAEAAGLGGRWVAFLSDAEMDAIDRVEGSGPWNNVHGEELFSGRAALEVAAPQAGINFDENGSATTGAWWTGSNDTSRHEASFSCNGWVSSDSLRDGATGERGTGRAWSSASTQRCDSDARLLCFEN